MLRLENKRLLEKLQREDPLSRAWKTVPAKSLNLGAELGCPLAFAQYSYLAKGELNRVRQNSPSPKSQCPSLHQNHHQSLMHSLGFFHRADVELQFVLDSSLMSR